MRKDASQSRDFVINGTFSKGLSTDFNPLEQAYDTSPNLINVVATERGVQTREGTTLQGVVDNFALSSVTLSFDPAYQLLVYRRDNRLTVGRNNDERTITNLVSWSVFKNPSKITNFVDLPTPEGQTKLVLTENHPPIQLFFLERRIDLSANATVVNYGKSILFTYLQEHGCIALYQDLTGKIQIVYVPGSSVNGTTKEVTLPSTASAAHPVVLINYYWQWWSESYLFKGNEFYDVTHRFGNTASDRHVPIPPNLRTGFDYASSPLTYFTTFKPWITAANRINPASPGNFTYNNNPTTNIQWVFSNGSPGTLTTNPNTADTADARTHMTFGSHTLTGIDTTSEGAAPVHLHRTRVVAFNAGQRVAPEEVYVYSGYKTPLTGPSPSYGRLIRSRTDPTSSEWEFTPVDEDGFPMTIHNLKSMTAISFEQGGTQSTGVPLTQPVKIVRRTNSHVHSSYITSATPYRAGRAVPAYGLGEFADYNRGYYPTTGVLYNGRLYLSGCAADPMRIVASAVTDSFAPGEYYTNFQIAPQTANDPNSAFDIRVVSDDVANSVVSLATLGGILAFTRNSLVRYIINGNEVRSEIVSYNGVSSPSAVVAVDTSVFLISQYKLFAVVPMEGLGSGYTTAELSTAVNGLLEEVDPNQYQPVLSLDTGKDLLWVQFSRRYQFLVNSKTNAWSTVRFAHLYSLAGGATVGTTDTTNRTAHYLWGDCAVYSTTQYTVVCTNSDVYLDFLALTANQPPATYLQLTFTGTNNRLWYNLNRGLAHTMLDGVDDLEVELGTTILSHIKDPPTYTIQYNKNGDYVVLTGLDPNNQNLKIKAKQNWEAPANPVHRLGVVLPGTYRGYTYPVSASTIEVNFNHLSKLKRLIRTSLLMDNAWVRGRMLTTDRWSTPPYFEVHLSHNHTEFNNRFTEVFTPEQLTWDLSLFDTNISGFANEPITLFNLPTNSVMVSTTLSVYSLRQNPLCWLGYQFTSNLKGNRYQRRR